MGISIAATPPAIGIWREMLEKWEVEVDHSTIHPWVLKYVPFRQSLGQT